MMPINSYDKKRRTFGEIAASVSHDRGSQAGYYIQERTN